MHAPLNHHHPRTIHACTIEPSNPRSRQPTLARQGKKQWRMTSNSIQMPTTLISMARAVLSRTTTRMSVATKTLRPGSSHTSNSSPKHLGSPTMCLVVFTCSFKFAMCVYTVCMHSKVRTHGHDTQTFAYGYITYKPCVFGVNTLSWPWTFTMCWEGTEKNLATIRSGPPGTRRAAETVFIMKIVRRDKKGRKQIDEGSAEFQDYLVRFEDINHSWKSKC